MGPNLIGAHFFLNLPTLAFKTGVIFELNLGLYDLVKLPNHHAESGRNHPVCEPMQLAFLDPTHQPLKRD